MYEHMKQPLLPKKQFYLRMLRSLAAAFILLIVTILIGTIGFRLIEEYSWIDSCLNSILIMTGIGMVGTTVTAAGKIFTGIFAVFSTLVFFTVLGIIFTPLLHRLLHKVHVDVK